MAQKSAIIIWESKLYYTYIHIFSTDGSEKKGNLRLLALGYYVGYVVRFIDSTSNLSTYKIIMEATATSTTLSRGNKTQS